MWLNKEGIAGLEGVKEEADAALDEAPTVESDVPAPEMWVSKSTTFPVLSCGTGTPLSPLEGVALLLGERRDLIVL